MNRQQILEAATAATCGERNRTYGPPDIQLECAEELANTLMRYRALMEMALMGDRGHGMRHISPAEWQALRQTCSKMSRAVCGPLFHPDNYVDGAAYMAIAGECAAGGAKIEDQAHGHE